MSLAWLRLGRRDPLRVLTLFARHGVAKYPGALEDLRELYRVRLPSVAHDLLVVDNAPSERGATPSSDTVVPGSNRFWEFSAWDEGLEHVGPRVRDYDLVHLVTSAFRTLYTRYLDRFDARMLETAARRRIALGHIDCYGEPVQLMGQEVQSWIRSSFLFVRPAELAALGSLVAVRDPAAIFSGDPASPFRSDAPLSARYQRLILDWLTGPGTGQGTTWHSRFDLTAETLPFFQAKALAILNEHMLAVRLRAQGCALVDATWLATHVARRGRAARFGGIPHWRAQLAKRDTDALLLPPSREASA